MHQLLLLSFFQLLDMPIVSLAHLINLMSFSIAVVVVGIALSIHTCFLLNRSAEARRLWEQLSETKSRISKLYFASKSHKAVKTINSLCHFHHHSHPNVKQRP